MQLSLDSMTVENVGRGMDPKVKAKVDKLNKEIDNNCADFGRWLTLTAIFQT